MIIGLLTIHSNILSPPSKLHEIFVSVQSRSIQKVPLLRSRSSWSFRPWGDNSPQWTLAYALMNWERQRTPSAW
jgi:hypothetical protein